MSIKVSTGLRNDMLVTDSFKGLMDSCTLKIYGGAVPATADDVAGSLLCEIFVGNDGLTPLTFEATASNGVVSKAAIESWAGTVGTTGTATHYRLELAADDQTLSTTQKRVQGVIDVAGADMNLTSVALILNAVQNIDYYSIALPTT